jgi:hypothetical protein
MSDLPYQDRYEGDNEERGIQVGDEVGFAVRIVCKNRLFNHRQSQSNVRKPYRCALH